MHQARTITLRATLGTVTRSAVLTSAKLRPTKTACAHGQVQNERFWQIALADLDGSVYRIARRHLRYENVRRFRASQGPAGQISGSAATMSTWLPSTSSRIRSSGHGQSFDGTSGIWTIGVARLRQPRAVEKRRPRQADRRRRAARRHLEPVDLRESNRPRRRL